MGTLISMFLRTEVFRLNSHSNIARLITEDPTPWISQPLLDAAAAAAAADNNNNNNNDAVANDPPLPQGHEDFILLLNVQRYLTACYLDLGVLVNLHATIRFWVFPRLRPFLVEMENRAVGREEKRQMEEVRRVARRASWLVGEMAEFYRNVFVGGAGGVGVMGELSGDDEAVLAFTSSFLALSAEITPAIMALGTQGGRRPDWEGLRALAIRHVGLIMDTWAGLLHRNLIRARLEVKHDAVPLKWRYCPGAVVLQALLRGDVSQRHAMPSWAECPTDILHPWQGSPEEEGIRERALNGGGRVKCVYCVHCGQDVEGWEDTSFRFAFQLFPADAGATPVQGYKALWYFAACHVQETREDGTFGSPGGERSAKKTEETAKLACRACGIEGGDDGLELLTPLEFARHLQASHSGSSEVNLELEEETG